MRAVNLLPRDSERQGKDGRGKAPLFAAAGGIAAATVGAVVVFMSASGSVSDQRAQLDSVESAIARVPDAGQPTVASGRLHRSGPTAWLHCPPLSRRAFRSTGCSASSPTCCPMTPGSRGSAPQRLRRGTRHDGAGLQCARTLGGTRRDDPGRDVYERLGCTRLAAPCSHSVARTGTARGERACRPCSREVW